MSLTKTILSFILTVTVSLTCQAQAEVAQVQGYLGTAIFPKENNGELMAGYKPGFVIGAGLSKTIKHAWVFNPNIEFTVSSKEHYSLSLVSIHNNLKYYPWLFPKVRPYAMVILNISFMNLHQEAYESTVVPDPSYSVAGPADIPVDQITYRYADLKLQFAPTLGFGIGIGVDIPVRLKMVPFLQYSYTAYTSKSSGMINDNFPNNTSGLSTQNIVAGVRYNLYKSLKK